jgi:RND family efflux transporter MFP subunit
LIAAAVFGLAAPVSAQPAALVQVAKAQERALRPTIAAYGTVAPDPDALATIALPREGVIAGVSVRVGQSVRAGDAIATVQTAAGASASFAQAQSALAFAEKDLAHTRQLYAQQLATATQLATAEKAVSDARAVLQAQTTIGAGKSSEVLRAKASGVVTAVNVSPGDPVQANAVIAAMAVRDRFIVNLGLEPSVALEVGRGDRVSLVAPQRPGTVVRGTVQSVDAMMDPKSRLVNAVVTIPEGMSRWLLLGTALDGTIYASANSGIVVPRSALMSDARGSYVYVVSRGVAHRRPVRIAFESDADALLKSGVSPGESVVVAGNTGIDDGSHVRVH